MTRNPHADAEQTARDVQRFDRIEAVNVSAVPSRTSTDPNSPIRHGVVTENYDSVKDGLTPVLTTAIGDVNVPTPDTTVLVARRRGQAPVVLGTLYRPDDEIPTYDPGERILTHQVSDSEVHFYPDGRLTVTNDDGTDVTVDGSEVRINDDTLRIESGTVRVNGGSTGVVTDASASTTKDADGHVTSVNISVTRSSDLFVP